jgi:hypothetical protein
MYGKCRRSAEFALTERHRSRTCLASGYDAVLVLKTSWGTSPGRSVPQRNGATELRSIALAGACSIAHMSRRPRVPQAAVCTNTILTFITKS